MCKMQIPNRLYAKTKGVQVAGSLFKAGRKEYFLVEDKMIPCTNEIANALYWTLCQQSPGCLAVQLTQEECRQIENVFVNYTCQFVGGYWMECKKCPA